MPEHATAPRDTLLSPRDTLPAPADGARRWRAEWLVALVFPVALLARGAFLWDQARHNPLYHAPIMDAFYHHVWAWQIASGESLGQLASSESLTSTAYFRAPLYYYLLAGLYAVFGPVPAVGRLAGAVLGAAACQLLALLGLHLAGWRVGLIAGLLAALYWPLLAFDTDLLTVGLENFLNVATILLLEYAARRRSLLLMLAAGLAFGLAIITRPTVLPFALLIAIWLLLVVRNGWPLPRRVVALALVGVAALVAVLPVTIRNYQVGHEWVLVATNGGVNFYIGNNPDSNGYSAVVPGTRQTWEGGYVDTQTIPARALGRPVTPGEVSDYWYGQAWAWIRSDPAAWLRLMLLKTTLFWSPIELANNQPSWFFARLSRIAAVFGWLGWPVAASLFVAGLAFALPKARTWFLVVTFFAVCAGTTILFFVNDRYRLPVVPVMLLVGAFGLERAVSLLRRRRLDDLRAYAVLLVLAALGLYFTCPDLKKFNAHNDGVGYQILGDAATRDLPFQPADRVRAVQYFRASLQASRENAYAMCRLAWLLSTAPEEGLRNGTEALSLVLQAQDLIAKGWAQQDTLEPLAAAYAETGRFEAAVQTARRALHEATQNGETARAELIRSQLQAYEAGRPFRTGDPQIRTP